MRPSGTEPVIRVMGEGDDKVLVEEVVDGIVDALTNAAGVSRCSDMRYPVAAPGEMSTTAAVRARRLEYLQNRRFFFACERPMYR